MSLIREVRVFDKNSIKVTFDFDDCYQECMDNLNRLGYQFHCDGNGKRDILSKDVKIEADSVCEPAGMERRAV